MVEKDVMVIVPIGEYEGIKMWRSEAIRQGLTYRLIGKEYVPEIEDKMVEPKENKASPTKPPQLEPVPSKTESAPKTTKRKTTKK